MSVPLHHVSRVHSKGEQKSPLVFCPATSFLTKNPHVQSWQACSLQVNLVGLVLLEAEPALRKHMYFVHGLFLPFHYSLGLLVGAGCVALLFSFSATLSWGLVLDSAWGLSTASSRHNNSGSVSNPALSELQLEFPLPAHAQEGVQPSLPCPGLTSSFLVLAFLLYLFPVIHGCAMPLMLPSRSVLLWSCLCGAASAHQATRFSWHLVSL